MIPTPKYKTLAGPWSPYNLGRSLVIAHDSRAINLGTDVAGTARPVNIGDAIAFRRDLSPFALHRTQSTVGQRPTWAGSATPGLTYVAASTHVMTGTAVAVPGPFTAYISGARAAAKVWVAVGHTTDTGSLLIYSDNNAYGINDAGETQISVPYTGATGRILARWRRTAAGVLMFAATGMAEVAVGAFPHVMTLNTEGARPTVAQYTDGTISSVYVVTADLVADGRDRKMRRFMKDQDGVILAA